MYGKIFESMYEGTLYGQWEAIVTMQQFIVIATPEGVVDLTPAAISGKTSIPLEIIEKGIEILSKPDAHSRTQGLDGVRIQLLDDHRPWGWFIVNHEKYKNMIRVEEKRQADRERVSNKRKSLKNNDVAECRRVSQDIANVAHKDKDSDSDKDKEKTSARPRAPSERSDFERFWFTYPRKVKKKRAREIWVLKKPDADQLIADVQNRLSNDAQWKQGFIPHPTTYLTGERWNDEIAADRQQRKPTYAEELQAGMRERGML